MAKLLLLITILGLALAPQQKRSIETDHARHSDAHLLEVGHASKLRADASVPAEIKVVSYNIRWRGGKSLEKLIEFLKTDPEVGGATLLGLQEVDRNKKRTSNVNTAKLIANELGMHYAWAAPPMPKSAQEEETGVMILSPYPLADIVRLVLPHDGPGKRRRAGIGATVKIGDSKVRVYSLHAETRVGMDKKLDQLGAAIKDLANHPKDMPAIIMGDFNTWQMGAEKKTKNFFTSEGFVTPFDGKPTFLQRVLLVEIALRLDWIWLRNVEVTNSGIDTKISVSDHWPLWVALKLKPMRG